MDNTSLGTRRAAKIIGYIDLFLVILLILVFAATSLVVFLWTQDVITNNSGVSLDDITLQGASVGILIIVLTLSAAYIIFRLWSVVTLISSTKLGTPVHVAWRKANFWRVSTLIFFVLRIPGLARASGDDLLWRWAILVISSIVDGIFLYFVSQYMTELDKLIPKKSSALPTLTSSKQESSTKVEHVKTDVNLTWDVGHKV